EVDKEFRALLTPDRIHSIVSLIPDDWLENISATEQAKDKKNVYAKFLENRISNSQIFVKEAQHARKSLI
ncbi:MAG TPA: hypothetical protein VM888_12005, partial [Chitinophagaceae bacterium]|nr:hypothetical protein [Chitinophagaceae bacterium]